MAIAILKKTEFQVRSTYLVIIQTESTGYSTAESGQNGLFQS